MVLKVTMIISVFADLSFVATTSSDEKYAREFLKPMVLRLRTIMAIRDIYQYAVGRQGTAENSQRE